MKPETQILAAARNSILHPKQWAKDIWGASDGPKCSLAAIAYGARSLGFNPLAPEAMRARETLRVCVTPDGNGSIAEWNDTHAHAEVLAGFQKAITLADRMPS